MSSEEFLLIRSTGDGRALLHGEHKEITIEADSTRGDTVGQSTDTLFVNKPPNYHIPIVAAISAIWTNMPAAASELFGNTSSRRFCELYNYTQWRLHVGVTTVSTAGILGVQYSVNAGVNWAGLDNGTDATNSTVTRVLSSAGSFVTAWTSIAAAAAIRANVQLRILGSGGDGAEDPDIPIVVVEVR